MAARGLLGRLLAWVFVIGLLLGIGYLPDGPAAVAQIDAEVQRVAGGDRYGTAAAISAATFGPDAGIAYVATGEDLADALTAGAAAAATGGPVLLTRRAAPSCSAAP